MAVTTSTTKAKDKIVVVVPTEKLIKDTVGKLAVVVNSEESEAKARERLTELDAILKKLEADRATLKRPHLDFNNEVDKTITPLKGLVENERGSVNRAIVAYLEYKERERKNKQNVINTRHEEKVEKAVETSLVTGEPMKEVAPARILEAAPNTVEVAGAKQTLTGFHTFDGIKGVDDPKDLTWEKAEQLGLDLPKSWFYLDMAQVTKVVKSQDRVPTCIQHHFEKTIAVTQGKK